MTYEALPPIDRKSTIRRLPPSMFALSVFFHIVILVLIPLLSGLFYKTRRFERPKTFQLVTAPRQTTPALPVPVNTQTRKQPAPQEQTTLQPQRSPVTETVKNDPAAQTVADAALSVNKQLNAPDLIPTGTPSPVASSGTTAPVDPVPASGQPRRIGSTAELDNVGFEPVFSIKPDYPVVAQEARITGYVDVDLVIGENGKIQSFTFVTIKGHPAFGVETARVLPRWRFPPPRIGGKKCSVKYVYRINFVLN